MLDCTIGSRSLCVKHARSDNERSFGGVCLWCQTDTPHSVCGCRHAGAVHRNQRVAVRHFHPYTARHEDVSPRCQPSREAFRHVEVQPCRAFSPSCGSLHLPYLTYLHLLQKVFFDNVSHSSIAYKSSLISTYRTSLGRTMICRSYLSICSL